MRYAVVIEKSETGFGAYVPDLPGCVALGETMTETEQLIREAVEFHLEGRSEEHTSELQSRFDLVCRLLLEKKKQKKNIKTILKQRIRKKRYKLYDITL